EAKLLDGKRSGRQVCNKGGPMNDQPANMGEAGGSPLEIGTTRGASLGRLRQFLLLGCLFALTTAGSCNSETLFKSNFDSTAANQPPSPTQAVGTASIDGPPGSVLVVVAPPNAQPSGKWLQISRPNGPQVASFQGKLTQQPGNGTYVFSTALFMPPSNTNVATIQFEAFNQPVGNPSGFLHLDFLPNNRVRIDDDDSTVFGQFPRNQV